MWPFCAIASITGLYLIYKLLDHILRIPYVGHYSDRYILITGCDSGFGRDLTKRLDALGCHVFAGCLTEKGETELSKSCSDRVVPIALDVTKPDNVRRAFKLVSDRLNADGKELWAVVNNAGVACPGGPPEWQTVDDYRTTLDVNLYGMIDVTMTFLPLVKRSRGRVVNMSSMAGFIVPFGFLPYCVSKYGVEAFTDGLRRSLRPYGCRVLLLEPGFHETDIISTDRLQGFIRMAWDRASAELKKEFGEEYYRYLETALPRDFHRLASDRISDVIDCYEHAVLGRHPRTRYVVGADARFLFWPLSKLPEWLSDRLLEMGALDPHRPLPAAVLRAQQMAKMK